MATSTRKKGPTIIYITLQGKLNIEQHEPHKKWGRNLVPRYCLVPAPLVAPVMLLINDTKFMRYGIRAGHQYA